MTADKPLELLGHAFAVGGRRREALKVLSVLRSSMYRRSDSLLNIALIHAALGQIGRAFKWPENPDRTKRLRRLADLTRGLTF